MIGSHIRNHIKESKDKNTGVVLKGDEKMYKYLLIWTLNGKMDYEWYEELKYLADDALNKRAEALQSNSRFEINEIIETGHTIDVGELIEECADYLKKERHMNVIIF